jgi:transcriptional regulator with XRE-family HTH domain
METNADNPTMPKKKPKRPKMTDQLRRHIETCGLSQYRICKMTGLSASTLSLFMNGERGVSYKVLDKLGEVLNLEIIMHGPAQS